MALPSLIEVELLRRRLFLPTILLIGVVAVGCSQPAGPIDEQTYIELMSQLSYAQARYLDPARADSARSAIMTTSGVSASDLLAFAEANGRDPQRMFALHEAVRARVDSLAALEAGALPGSAESPTDPGDTR